MKIELIKYTFDNGNIGYKCKPMRYCCGKLKDNPIIDLVDEYTIGDYTEDLFPSVSIWEGEDYTEWGEDYHTDNYYKINYCPFCGEPIEISVVKEMDLSELYSKLENQRKELWSKYNRTDSIKKRTELENHVRELDSKIDWFYQLCEWDGSTDFIDKVGD